MLSYTSSRVSRLAMALLTLAALSSASPLPTTETPASLEERQVYFMPVNICSDLSSNSTCKVRYVPNDTCNRQSSISIWAADGISSFRPNLQGISCDVYRLDGCEDSDDGKTTISFPGVQDLQSIGWDKAIQSFSCSYSSPQAA